MKRFIINTLIFILIAAFTLNIRPLYLSYKGKYKLIIPGFEIYHSIVKSKQKNRSKKLLLGDSVANQLFYNFTCNDSINSLACNQGIGLVGQYILLNNYLNAGNKIDTVYMILEPISFQNNLDQIYTYHYFLKPFYVKENLLFFTKTVNNQISKIPYVKFCRIPYILTSSWAPRFYSTDTINYTFLSPISKEYLTKIKQLSITHEFKLIIRPPLLSYKRKAEIEKLNKKETDKYNFSEDFKNYFDRIVYINDSNFVDGTHFKTPQKYLHFYYNNIMK